ncbi:MAG: dienelactone hydrolase family protein [Bacteroidota bacterium]
MKEYFNRQYNLLSLRCLILFLSAVTTLPSNAQQISNDPFQPYLTKKPPEIIIDHGFEKLPNGIRLRKLVFRSRSLMTDSGVKVIKVFAAIAYPAEPGKYPAVIRLHGGGGKADLDVAENFAKQGYVSLVLDIPGVADEVKNNKEGAWPKLPMITAKPDVTHSALFSAVAASIQAFYLLRSQPDVDTTRMGIAGGSWGGYVATMLSTLVNNDVAATWSVFGTGNFLAGANEKPNIEKLPAAEKSEWVKYLDPGMRAANITKPYYIITASNDRHWSWMAVQATLSSIKGHTSVLYSPNDNHKINYPGSWRMMEFFNYYLKKYGPPLPELIVVRAKLNKKGQLDVVLKPINAGNMAKVNVFYSNPELLWTQREWKQVPASVAGQRFTASIPNAAFKNEVDWYATITDKNSAWSDSLYSASTWIHQIKKK